VLEGDVLTFAGDVESVHTALNTPGLTVEAGAGSFLADEATLAGGGAPATSSGGALNAASSTAALTSDKNSDLGADDAAVFTERGGRALIEAVVGVSSPLVGKTVRASGFRTHYGGSIIAVHRGAERVYGRIGDIQLRGGDSLLVEAPPDFVERYRHHRDFALVSSPFVPDSVKHDPLRILFSIAAFIAMIAINSADIQELSVTAMLVLYAFFFTRVLTPDEFRASIPGQVLLMVASGFGVAQALRATGLAKQIGNDIFGAFQWMGPYGSVFATYLATEIMTILLSNGAAVTILFPIVRSIAAAQGTVAPKAYLYALALAGSSDFMTPTGYQTNAMVQGKQSAFWSH
jgi:di/tricarboxylate transporter